MAAESIAYQKSLAFGQRMVKLYRYMMTEQKEYARSTQVLRSGTSIGANIAETRLGTSKKDFVAKIYIALKECAETLYWLELLYSSGYVKEEEYQSLFADCEELRKVLSATAKTAQRRISQPSTFHSPL